MYRHRNCFSGCLLDFPLSPRLYNSKNFDHSPLLILPTSCVTSCALPAFKQFLSWISPWWTHVARHSYCETIRPVLTSHTVLFWKMGFSTTKFRNQKYDQRSLDISNQPLQYQFVMKQEIQFTVTLQVDHPHTNHPLPSFWCQSNILKRTKNVEWYPK
jgi:hypothetical protein